MTRSTGALCAITATNSEVTSVFQRRETNHTQGERGILGDEELARLLTTIEQLRSSVADLKSRVDSQFTTIAAHAEIAREQAEFARAEARADLERTRDTLIELVEQVRFEAGDRSVAVTSPGPSQAVATERVERLEHTVTALASTVERCFVRQNELADTMTAFLDTITDEARGEPVAGLSLG